MRGKDVNNRTYPFFRYTYLIGVREDDTRKDMAC